MKGTAALDNSVAYELYVYTIDAYKRLANTLVTHIFFRKLTTA